MSMLETTSEVMMEQTLVCNTTVPNLTWLPALLYLIHNLFQSTCGQDLVTYYNKLSTY